MSRTTPGLPPPSDKKKQLRNAIEDMQREYAAGSNRGEAFPGRELYRRATTEERRRQVADAVIEAWRLDDIRSAIDWVNQIGPDACVLYGMIVDTKVFYANQNELTIRNIRKRFERMRARTLGE